MSDARTPIEVVIPEMKLTLEDLAYLKTLGDKVRCYAKDRVVNKLVFLGLIEDGEIPPCPKALADWEKKTPGLIADAELALKRKNWRLLYDCAYSLHHSNKKPEPTKGKVLTAAGNKILATGRTMSTTTKKGACL